jgi:hypothetical protein
MLPISNSTIQEINMGTLYTNFEQVRIENEVAKIVTDLVSMGGINWAMETVSKLPQFTDPYQENLRISLQQKLGNLNTHVL